MFVHKKWQNVLCKKTVWSGGPRGAIFFLLLKNFEIHILSINICIKEMHKQGYIVTLVAFACYCLHCVFSDVSSNCLPERMQSHIGCIYLTCLHCVFSNVSSNRLPHRMQSHIDCICLAFLHCAFSNVS